MNQDHKTLGIDLAMNIFQLYGANGAGKSVLSKRPGREQFIEFISHCTPCPAGIEACSVSHYWARTLQSLGHEIKIKALAMNKPLCCEVMKIEGIGPMTISAHRG